MKKGIFIGHGRYEEYVSEFAEAAFTDQRARVDELLISDTDDCLNDPHVLDALIVSRNEKMFSYLLSRGVRPQYRDYYYALSLRGEEFFRHLPENKEWTLKARARVAEEKIHNGLLRGTLAPEDLKKYLVDGASLNEFDVVEPDHVPIILSARYPALEIITILIRAGANPEVLNKNGKNVFRLILENEDLLREERKELVRFFKARGISPVPGLTWSEKIKVALLWKI